MTNDTKNCEIAIIGGGLSGLSLAMYLQEQGHDFQLFEAKERFGGRILSNKISDAYFDLGPSWFWPGQHRITTLTEQLNLETFEQFSHGDLIYEQIGKEQQRMNYATMAGALRINGGMNALVEGIVSLLDKQRLHLGEAATNIDYEKGITFNSGNICKPNKIVLALPPRLAAQLSISPELEKQSQNIFQSVPTWMAGHAKFVAVYSSSFWRETGLSGDAMSQIGPLAEIHDASTVSGQPGALFGFLGVTAKQRRNIGDDLKQSCLNQLVRLFGEQAATPIRTWLVDWAQDPFLATEEDETPLAQHPRYGLSQSLPGDWADKLFICSTETAHQNGGLLEGALEASETMAKLL